MNNHRKYQLSAGLIIGFALMVALFMQSGNDDASVPSEVLPGEPVPVTQMQDTETQHDNETNDYVPEDAITVTYPQNEAGDYQFYDLDVTPREGWDILFSHEDLLSFAWTNAAEGVAGNGIEIERFEDVDDINTFANAWASTTNCEECYMQPLFVTENVYLIVDLAAMGYIGNFIVAFEPGTAYRITVFDQSLRYEDVLDTYITYRN